MARSGRGPAILALRTALVAGVAIVLSASPAGAQCGGFCIYEVATPQMGESYAGAGATADDAATAYLNPAGMTRLDGINYLAGIVMSQVVAGFDLDPSGTSASAKNADGGFNDGGSLGGVFPFGGVYLAAAPPAALHLPDGLRFGFAFNNIYGGDLSYDPNWAGRTYITRTRFFGVNFEPSLAYRVKPWLSLGAGANVLYYRLTYNFRSSLFVPTAARPLPLPGRPDAETIKIHGADDWAASFTLGLLLTPTDETRIGLVYRHQFDVALRGFATVYDTDFASDFQLPKGVNVSVAHDVTPRWTVLGDVGWSDWSAFNEQVTSYRSVPGIGPYRLSGFRQWRDTWRIAAGLRRRFSDAVLGRVGLSFDSSPVPATNRLPDIPAGTTWRGSLGVDWRVWAPNDRTAVTVGLTYTLLWQGDTGVDRVLLPDTGVTLDGSYRPDFASLVGLTLAARF